MEGDDGAKLDVFRPEAIDAARSRLGSPVRSTGVSSWLLTSFFVLLLGSAAIFLSLATYTRKETVTGTIQPSTGSVKVTVPRSGVVSDVHVVEGQLVAVGAPIVSVSNDTSLDSDTSHSSLGDQLAAAGQRESLAVAENARAQAEVSAMALLDLRSRREGLVHDQRQLSRTIDLQGERVRLARETFEAGEQLHAKQLFSTIQLRQREEAVISAQQSLESLRREVSRNAASLRQLDAEEGRVSAQLNSSNAQARQAAAQMDEKRLLRLAERSSVVTARRSGRMAALQARTGTPVQPGQVIAFIIPENGRLQAELWVPSRAIGFLRRGVNVRIMYDAFPYQKFGAASGEVVFISNAPVEVTEQKTPDSEPMFKVLVDLSKDSVLAYNENRALTPGMGLTADLILDRRTFWEWLLDPLYAAARRDGKPQ